MSVRIEIEGLDVEHVRAQMALLLGVHAAVGVAAVPQSTEPQSAATTAGAEVVVAANEPAAATVTTTAEPKRGRGRPRKDEAPAAAPEPTPEPTVTATTAESTTQPVEEPVAATPGGGTVAPLVKIEQKDLRALCIKKKDEVGLEAVQKALTDNFGTHLLQNIDESKYAEVAKVVEALTKAPEPVEGMF